MKKEKTAEEKALELKAKKAKERLVKKEITRLKALFIEVEETKKNLVESTIEDVAFLTVTMRQLRQAIYEDGTTVEYKNGENQYGTKQSPDAQFYLQFSQKLSTAMKILIDCIPKKKENIVEDDGFDDFVLGREDI